MNIEKMREEFEAWIKADWQGVHITRNPENSAMFSGQYQEDRVHMAWKSWQASRESLVIELPEFWDCGAGGDVLSKEEVIGAIEVAGLKVKP